MNHSHEVAGKLAIIYMFIGAVWLYASSFLSLGYILLTGVILYLLTWYWTGKMLELELGTKGEKAQSLFRNYPDSVLELDLAGRIVSVNPGAEAFFGVQKEALQGMHVDQLIHGEIRESGYVAQSLEGNVVEFDRPLQNAKKLERILGVTFFPIFVGEEQTGIFALLRDVTELRQKENRALTSAKLSVTGKLAAAIAHEIRNPLTTLKGFVQLMDMTKEVNPVHTDVMLKEIEQIDMRSSELLLLGKKQDIPYKLLDLQECLKQVVTVMEGEGLGEIEMLMDVKVESPVMVLGDSMELKLLFNNIIKNSIEAVREHGKIEISLQIVGGDAIVNVRDNGVGMETELLERIGEPFYSLKEKGTGLGLTVCQAIIHRLNGEMRFESAKQIGTTVTIRIPLATTL